VETQSQLCLRKWAVATGGWPWYIREKLCGCIYMICGKESRKSGGGLYTASGGLCRGKRPGDPGNFWSRPNATLYRVTGWDVASVGFHVGKNGTRTKRQTSGSASVVLAEMLPPALRSSPGQAQKCSPGRCQASQQNRRLSAVSRCTPRR
jgi:hypothetical protein